jgi:O-antigen ligase
VTATATLADDLLSRIRTTLRTDPGAWLALVAFGCWLAGHVPALAPVAIPAWVVTGLATGLLRPWYGLLLTAAVVPFLGGATDVLTGEPLRVVPVYAAAVRVLLDRFVIAPSYGRPVPREPAWPVVAAAVLAAGLYLLTALTAFLGEGGDARLLADALRWVAGGSVAMMAAWIAASHLVADVHGTPGRDRTLTLVVLGTTVVACGLALAAFAGLPGADLVTFPGRVEEGRLAALGFPTPTAIGLAIALPLAAVAAWRIRPRVAVGVVALVLVTIVLTWSRGPLLAVVVGAVVATLASGRVDRRLALAGAAAGAVALVALVGIRYGTGPDAILATVNASMGSDEVRVRSWMAALSVAAANPLVGGGWHGLERVDDFAAHAVFYSHNIVLFAFAEGGLPLGIANAVVIAWSAWRTWLGRHTMAVWLIAAVVTALVCGIWDMPQVRSYGAVMAGLVLGMAAGPLVGRPDAADAAAAPARRARGAVA